MQVLLLSPCMFVMAQRRTEQLVQVLHTISLSSNPENCNEHLIMPKQAG